MMMHKEARKSIGILEIAKKFNISKNEIKIIADHICDTNDNDGVAKWLEENILR